MVLLLLAPERRKAYYPTTQNALSVAMRNFNAEKCKLYFGKVSGGGVCNSSHLFS